MTIRYRVLASCVAASLPSFGCSVFGVGEADTELSASCAEAPNNDIAIASVSIPGQGSWPDELVAASGTSSRAAPAPSGSGCDWTDSGYSLTSIHCSGWATVVQTANQDEFAATFEGGAVARFSLPGAVLPTSGELQLELSRSRRKSNPYGGVITSSSSVARDTAGQLVWLVTPEADEQLDELLGAPVRAIPSCRTRFDDCLGVFDKTVFDHLVQSEPQQRIVAAEPTLIDAPNGEYLITWYSAELEQRTEQLCPDADLPRTGNGVRALLQR